MVRTLNFRVLATLGVLLAGPAQSAELFNDEFEGDILSEYWNVVNPNPENYVVEGGVLLTVFAKESSIDSDELQNLFRLTTALPKGDWQATIRLQPEYQTLREVVYFGTYHDKANYMMVTMYVNSWCCYGRNLTLMATKNAAGKKAQFSKALSPNANLDKFQFDAYGDFFAKLGKGILLRLIKTGRQYVFAGRIEGTSENGKPFPWVEMFKLTSLRQKGELAFGFTQAPGGGHGGHISTGGESIVNVDWVKIETLD